MWSECAGCLSVERNVINLFLKNSPQNYDFVRIIKKLEKYVIKFAKNTIKHGVSYTGNDVIWSILTVSSELRLAMAGAACRWNRSVLVLEVFLAYQCSAFPSITVYVRIPEFYFSWTAKLGFILWKIKKDSTVKASRKDGFGRWSESCAACWQQAEFKLWRHPLIVLLCSLKNVLRTILYLQTTT